MQYAMGEMNQEYNRYQPSALLENSPLELVSYEINQHLDTNQQDVSPEYKEIEYFRRVENQNFSLPFIASEYNQIELGRHKINAKFDTNQLIVSSEYSRIEYYNK
ncbi:hypothetical protein TNCV_5035341 [Trichonephila clavipes]|nr:hypothetical protein TNCV_5035341 [Trichonephila clavipes]